MNKTQQTKGISDTETIEFRAYLKKKGLQENTIYSYISAMNRKNLTSSNYLTVMHHYNKFKIESIQSDVEPDYDSLGPICEGSPSNLDFVFGFDLDSPIIRRNKQIKNPQKIPIEMTGEQITRFVQWCISNYAYEIRTLMPYVRALLMGNSSSYKTAIKLYNKWAKSKDFVSYKVGDTTLYEKGDPNSIRVFLNGFRSPQKDLEKLVIIETKTDTIPYEDTTDTITDSEKQETTVDTETMESIFTSIFKSVFTATNEDFVISIITKLIQSKAKTPITLGEYAGCFVVVRDSKISDKNKVEIFKSLATIVDVA